MLLVGTRKGCFVLESDDRPDWSPPGPYCDGWPIYHAVHDAESGSIYAAAASEWHGSGVWRSGDLGESWQLSSEGLSYDGTDQKLSKVSGLTAAHGRLLAGVENAGLPLCATEETFSLLSTLEGQPKAGLERSRLQPPGHLGLPAVLPHPTEPARFWAVVQGIGIFETTDDGESWTLQQGPAGRLAATRRGRVLRAQAGMSPVDTSRMYQQNHCGMYRATMAGSRGSRSPTAANRFRLAAAAHPHDRDTFYVIRSTPATAASCRMGTPSGARRRLDLAAARQGAAHAGRPPRRASGGMAIDGEASRLYFGTSTGQVFASADEATRERSRAICRRSRLSGRGGGDV
jgi:hypothetical protein